MKLGEFYLGTIIKENGKLKEKNICEVLKSKNKK